ncbi:3'-5' exonuclease [Actinoplanes cyaneus]|uniref:3'-5' exonuclease n=1 Tax=Actinoplanes cyaneus TaxID=52696 RepID=UPI002226C1C7
MVPALYLLSRHHTRQTTQNHTKWRPAVAVLVALDLEGTGSQDRDQEQILETAAVRFLGGRPDMATAYTTGIDPGRAIPVRPWISPGLAGTALRGQPTLDDVRPALLARLTGAWLVGHNIGVDWRLLHRHLPELTVAGLIDTMRLAKGASVPGKLGLIDLLTYLQLTAAVTAAAPGSRPHRALWDTAGTALLLPVLIRQHFTTEPALQQLAAVAGIGLAAPSSTTASAAADPQPTLFD